MSAASARTIPDFASTSVASPGTRRTAAAIGVLAGLAVGVTAGLIGVPFATGAIAWLILVALLTGLVASWSP